MSTSAEFARQIHQRLLAKDPVAPSELVENYLEPLIQRLRSRNLQIRDETLIYDAAIDAIFNYTEHPSRFNPSKSHLFTYLAMSAQGDLLNALEKRRRQMKREISLEAVEESLGDRNKFLEDKAGEAEETHDLDNPARQELLQQVFEAIPDVRDRKLLQLMLDGERSTAAYSAVLDIQAMDLAEQRRVVKQHKDRLKKRLERLGVKLREQPIGA